MARLRNAATHNASGKVGSLLYRKVHGDSVMGNMPGKSTRPLTESQQQIRSRFSEAAMYAKSALANPELFDFYKSKSRPGKSAYVVALTDYLRSPEVKDVDTSSYNGSIGSTILVKAFDDGRLTSVKFRIEKGNGSLVEEGEAVMQMNVLHWTYTAIAANDSFAGTRITIKATDLPGNVTVKQILL
jgi:hypothetical protein